MTEREKFLAHLGQSRHAGLVDVKFFFHPTQATKPEEIFGALNQVEDAIQQGNCVRHTGWNDDEPAVIA